MMTVLAKLHTVADISTSESYYAIISCYFLFHLLYTETPPIFPNCHLIRYPACRVFLSEVNMGHYSPSVPVASYGIQIWPSAYSTLLAHIPHVFCAVNALLCVQAGFQSLISVLHMGFFQPWCPNLNMPFDEIPGARSDGANRPGSDGETIPK